MMSVVHHLYLLAPGATEREIRAFYADTLGLPEVQKPASLAAVTVLWFSAGAVVFHVGYPATGSVGGGHTALAIDNLDVLRERLVTGGYAIDDNVIPMGYPRFYARDPWGNQFEMLPAGLP